MQKLVKFNFKIKIFYTFVRQLLSLIRKKSFRLTIQPSSIAFIEQLAQKTPIQLLPITRQNFNMQIKMFPEITTSLKTLFNINWFFYITFLQEPLYYSSWKYIDVSFKDIVATSVKFKRFHINDDNYKMPLISWNIQHYYFLLAYFVLKKLDH